MKKTWIILCMLAGLFGIANAHDININSTTNIYEAAPAPVTNVTEVTNLTGLPGSTLEFIHASTAAAMAAGSCQFDYSPGLQGCGSTWNFEGEWGVNFQVGKRVDDLLFNGGCSIGLIDGSGDELIGCGGAVNWHF